MTTYLDFDIDISAGDGNSYSLAVRSPAGEARAVLTLPFTQLERENYLKDVQIALLRTAGVRRRISSSEEQSVQLFGQQLFDALFVDEIRARYDVSQAQATQQHKGLRLRLRVTTPELAALPWELLFDSRRHEFVCLSANTPLVRYFDLPQPPAPLEVTAPLRILAMIVSPSDLPILDFERERRRLESAIASLQADGLVELHWLGGQTWRDLQRELHHGPWHIFQFIGHGGFNSTSDEGFLVFATADGEAQRIPATNLARLLGDHAQLRLAILNACEGAHPGQYDLFASTAATLIRRRLPAVVAMQYEITDESAIEFTQSFYEALADSLPVDEAVAEARKAISISNDGSIEWLVPVLYMRAPNGTLFAWDASIIPDRPKYPRVTAPSLLQSDMQNVGLEQRLALAESLGTWDIAIQLGERLLEQGTQNDELYKRIAHAYRERGIKLRFEQTFDKALIDFERAITLESSNPINYYWRGECYGLQDNLVQAMIDFDFVIAVANQVIARDMDNAELYHARGGSYSFKGDYKCAINDINKAIEIDASIHYFYYNRGNIYFKQDKYEDAVVDYSRAIEIEYNIAEYYKARGHGYYSLSEYKRAITDYSQAIQLTPTNATYYNLRGNAYYAQGNYKSAITDYSQAIQLTPTNATYYNLRGNSYYAQGNYKRAIADYSKAIKFMPNVAIYYGNRGNSYYAQEDYERAITDYSKAIQIAPEDGQYYYARGNSYIASDNRALARDDYKRAVQLGYEQAREELGLIDNLILTIIKIIFSWRLLLLYLIILLKSFHFC